MDNRRTDTARENDDSDLIDSIEPTPSQGGTLRRQPSGRRRNAGRA